jgi:hypothetical protein
MMTRQHEPGIDIGLPLRVCGIDIRGRRFLQEADARSISLTGALLSQFEAQLRTGDVVSVFYREKKARFRVIWARPCDGGSKIQVAIHRVEADECPWLDLLSETSGGHIYLRDPVQPAQQDN